MSLNSRVSSRERKLIYLSAISILLSERRSEESCSILKYVPTLLKFYLELHSLLLATGSLKLYEYF